MALNITLREATTNDIINCANKKGLSSSNQKIQPLTSVNDLLDMVPGGPEITAPEKDERDIPPPKIVDVDDIGKVDGEVVLSTCKIPREEEIKSIGSSETSSISKPKSTNEAGQDNLITVQQVGGTTTKDATRSISGGEEKKKTFSVIMHNVSRNSINQRITVTFSEELKYKEQFIFFEINPPIEGQRYWLGKRTMVFSPNQDFPNSTHFKCKIKKGTMSKSGERLTVDYEFDFGTPRISLQCTLPTSRFKVHSKCPLYLSFTQRIDHQKILELLCLTSRLSIQNIPLQIIDRNDVEERIQKLKLISMSLYKDYMIEFERGDPAKSIWFSSVEDLLLSTSYSLSFGEEISSLEGPLKKEIKRDYQFSTFPQFCHKGSSHDVLPLQRFRIWFNNVIDKSRFDPAKMIKIEPHVEDLQVVPSEKSLYFSGKTEGNTLYNITIKKSLRDVYGIGLKKSRKVRVKVTRAAKTLQAFSANLVVLDPTHPKSTTFSVVVCNIKSLRMTVFRVHPKEYNKSPVGPNSDENWLRKRRGVSKTISCPDNPDNPTEVCIDLLPFLQFPKQKVGHLFIVIKPMKSKKDDDCDDEVMAWVQVTKLAFDIFCSHDEKMFIYSNSLENGEVVRNAKFTYIPDTKKKKSVHRQMSLTTNEFGLCCFDPVEFKNAYNELNGTLICTRGKDSVFTTTIPSVLPKPNDKLLHFIFDDRKLYKPKEEIHIKGFFRNLVRQGPIYNILKIEDREIKYKVLDGRGEEFLSSQCKIEDGAFHIFFRIPEKPNLGTFKVVFEMSEDKPTITHTFKVEMFRTPEFFVNCKSDQSYYIVRDDFVMKSLAKYYSGGPLSDASCEWVVEQQSSSYRPPGHSGYSFYCDVLSSTNVARREVKFKGTSNIDGEHNVCVSSVYVPHLSQEEKYSPVSLTVRCHIQDLNKQVISGQKKITVHPSGLYIGANCDTVYESVNKKIRFDIVVANIDGVVQKNIRFSVFVKRRENVNLWTKRYNLKHAYHFESEAPKKTIELAFPNDGSHMIIFKVFDGENRSHACSHRVHIFDPQKKYRSRNLDNSFDLGKNISKQNIMLLPNKTKFNVGENCRLLIDANPLTPPISCYIHIYTDGLVMKEFLVMNSQTQIYDLKIHREYVPNISVELYCVGKIEKGVDEKGIMLKRPAFASKKIDLAITLEHSELSVILKPENEVVRPGSSTKVNIKIFPKSPSITDFEGALATVVVVDEAVLNLANYRIKNPLKQFFPRHNTNSRDTSSRTEVFLKNWEDIQIQPPAPPTVESFEIRRRYRTIPMVEIEVNQHVEEKIRTPFRFPANTPHFRPVSSSTREIATIQVGQCGNQIGEEFWNSLRKEHDLNYDGYFENVREGNEGMEIYFREHPNTKLQRRQQPSYFARSLLIDTDDSIVDGIRSRKLYRFFRPENCITSSIPTGNNWAKGHYTLGAEMVDMCLDALRREIEMMDNMDGYKIIHSLGGGTGSGLGTLMLSKIREDYPDRMASTVTILPSISHPSSPIEAYNATLSIHQLVENADMCFLYHNECLYKTCSQLGFQKPNFRTINSIVSRSLSDISSSFRYNGYLNGNLRKMAVNLVPFPRLHFFGIQSAPNDAYGHYTYPNVRDVTMKLFHHSSNLTNFDPRHGRYTTAYAIFRGGGTTSLIEQELLSTQNTRSSYFVEWIPNNTAVSMIPYTRDNKGQLSACLIGNSTAVQEPIKRISEIFTAMFRRKAFLHWYTGEGMDEMEFTEAESNMNDLISEYQQYQDATADEDGELEWGEGEEEWDDDEMMEEDGPPPPVVRQATVISKKKKMKRSAPPKKAKVVKKKKEEGEEKKEKKKKDEKKKEIKLRKDFRALAAYVDLVKSDSTGIVDVPIQIPDNLTRFRVSVIASSGNEQWGLGETVIRTNLPFTIKPSPPRFVRLSDIFVCPVVVQNQHSLPVSVRVAVQVSPNLKCADIGFHVELQSKERAILPVQVRVEDLGLGEGKLRFVGEARVIGFSESFVDAVEKKIPIHPPHTIENFSVSGLLKNDNSRVVQPISIDDGISILPGETNCFFRVSNSAVSCLADSYEYICSYKFMCCEQTSSKILSLISLLDIRDRFYTPPEDIEDEKEQDENNKNKKKRRRKKKKKKKRKKYGYVLPTPTEIRENIKEGLLNLVKKQGVSGGFGFWSRQSMHPMGTLHASMATLRVLERDDPGLSLPPMMLRKLVDCLSNFKNLLKKDKYISKRTFDELISQSYFLLSIYHCSNKVKNRNTRILSKEGVSKGVVELLKKSQTNFLTRCYCILALSKLGKKKNEELIKTETQSLLAFVQEERNTAFVVEKFKEDLYNSKLIALSSSGKVNALFLEVLLETLNIIPENDDVTHKIARHLLNKRGTSNSRWSNTNLCCHCNLALNKYYLKYEKDNEGISEFLMGFKNSHVSVELQYPKKCSHSKSISLSQVDVSEEVEGEEEEEEDDDNNKKIKEGEKGGGDLMAFIQRTKGNSSLYYSMSFRYCIANLITSKIDDQGFSLKRFYRPVDYTQRENVKRKDIHSNEWIVKNGSIVKVELAMYTPSSRYHVALVDFLPGGFEIMNPEFSVIPKDRTTTYNRSKIWYSHQNMRDDRIEVFSEMVHSGVSYYVYYVRATACGKFIINPGYCEEMYDTQIFGRTETNYVRIVED